MQATMTTFNLVFYIIIIIIQLQLIQTTANDCRCTFDDWSSSLTCNLSNSVPRPSEICGEIQHLNQVTHLEMTEHNNIPGIERQTFIDYTSLDTIVMEGCGVRNITSRAFQGCESTIKDLRLADNKLQRITDAFSQLRSLKYLFLMNNKISVVDDGAFQGMPNLIVLYLSQNYITHLPNGIFQSLQSLSSIHLESNYITSVPENFLLQSRNLLKIFAQENNIIEVSSNAFATNTNLRKIDLQQNQITNFSFEIIHNLESLESLDISGNNLICSCNMMKVGQWYSRSINNTIPSCRYNQRIITLTSVTRENCQIDPLPSDRDAEYLTTRLYIKSTQSTKPMKRGSSTTVQRSKPITKYNQPKNIEKTDYVTKSVKPFGAAYVAKSEDGDILSFITGNILTIIIAVIVILILSILLVLVLVTIKKQRKSKRGTGSTQITANRETISSNHTYDSVNSRPAIPSCSSDGSTESADSTTYLLRHNSVTSTTSSYSLSSRKSSIPDYADNISTTSFTSYDETFHDPPPTIIIGVNQSGHGRKYSRSLSTDRTYLTPIPERRNIHTDPLPPRPGEVIHEPRTQEAIYVSHDSLNSSRTSQPENHYIRKDSGISLGDPV